MGGECIASPDCKYYNGAGCAPDTHHIYWPRAEYKTRLEKDFRNLGCNVVELCRREHDEIHANSDPLPKPSRDEMWRAVYNTIPRNPHNFASEPY